MTPNDGVSLFREHQQAENIHIIHMYFELLQAFIESQNS